MPSNKPKKSLVATTAQEIRAFTRATARYPFFPIPLIVNGDSPLDFFGQPKQSKDEPVSNFMLRLS